MEDDFFETRKKSTLSNRENMTFNLSADLLEIISCDFEEAAHDAVIAELFSIHLNHLMANSEYNLTQTRYAILTLADGDLKDVIEYPIAAKIDFRDLIMWAGEKLKG
jgi:hypothetical protein